MRNNKIKIVTQSLLVAILALVLGARVALAQTYSSFNNCLGNNQTDAECCALPQFASDTADCGSGGSTNGTNLVNGSPCVTSQACSSGNCSAGVCALPGTSATTNLNGNSSSGSTGSNPICDTSSGTYQLLPSGLCVPTSPFNGGLASQSTLSGLITTILNIILTLSGIIAVIFIIIGGFQYMTAGGNEEQSEKGRKALTNAIIGLLIVILAFTIVQVVTNTLTSASPVGIINTGKL